MRNWDDKSWEIHDAKGRIFKGNQDDMLLAWNINYLSQKHFKQVYGHTVRKQKWKIKEWHGDLRLIHVIDYTNFKTKGVQRWNEKDTGKF
jgi:hypothetical protein